MSCISSEITESYVYFVSVILHNTYKNTALWIFPFFQWRWVTRGGNWGCHPSLLYFFPEKPGDLFCSSLSLFIDFTRVSLGEGVTTHLFYLSDLVSPLFFVNLPTKFFFLRVSAPWRVSPGAAPHPVTPMYFFWSLSNSPTFPRFVGE